MCPGPQPCWTLEYPTFLVTLTIINHRGPQLGFGILHCDNNSIIFAVTYSALKLKRKMTAVEISRDAHAKVMLHLAKHPSNVIHGILVGTYTNKDDSNQLEINDVYPVCHSVPTKPLLDFAFKLADANLSSPSTIVGWYSANARVGDEEPGVLSLKVIENINGMIQESDAGLKPVLMMINNTKLGGKNDPYQFYSANGEKLINIKTHVDTGSITMQSAFESQTMFWDFEDHMDEDLQTGDGEQDWMTNKHAKAFASA